MRTPLLNRLRRLALTRAAVAQRGSVSLMMLIVFIPLLFIGLTVTVEVGNFLSVREEVRGIVDREALAALRERAAPAVIEARMRDRLKPFSPMVTVNGVSTQSAGGKMRLMVDAEFRSYFAEFLLVLAGRPDGWKIPLSQAVVVRKVTSSTLVVLDRLVSDAAAGCSDPGLEKAKGFAGALAHGLQRSGAAQVVMGVVPGTKVDLQVVGPPRGFDAVPLCGSEEWNVQGVQGKVSPAMNIAFDLGVSWSEAFPPPLKERNVVVFVVRQDRANQDYVKDIVQGVGALAQRLGVRLAMVMVRVDPADGSATGLESLAQELGMKYREVAVSSDAVGSRELVTAVVGEVAESAMIAE